MNSFTAVFCFESDNGTRFAKIILLQLGKHSLLKSVNDKNILNRRRHRYFDQRTH